MQYSPTNFEYMKENMLYVYSKSYERTLHYLPILDEIDGFKLAERILKRENNPDLLCEIHANGRVTKMELKRA